MFEIKLTDTDATNGSIPVSWCLDLETINFLSTEKCTEPMVVILVAPEDTERGSRKEYRTVVPLKDLMTYIEFRVPGKNKIWAFISRRTPKDARNHWLSKSGGRYESDILDTEGHDWSWCFYFDENNVHKPEIAATPLAIDVPDGIFAPEPSELEKTWVNHLFRNKCVDQCDFRRRRMFAYTVQPVLFAAQMVMRAVFLVMALLIGSRGTSIQPLLHPMRYDFMDATDIIHGGTIFWRKLPEDDNAWYDLVGMRQAYYILRKLSFLPFMPIIAMVLAFIAYHAVGHLALAGALLLTTAVVLTLILFFITGAPLDAASWIFKKIDGLIKPKTKMSNEKELWYMDKEEMEFLTCSPEKKPFTMNTLPAKKKSLKLRFYDLKSKVCRPFAG